MSQTGMYRSTLLFSLGIASIFGGKLAFFWLFVFATASEISECLEICTLGPAAYRRHQIDNEM